MWVITHEVHSEFGEYPIGHDNGHSEKEKQALQQDNNIARK